MFLADGNDSVIQLCFKSNKVQRVTWSVVTAELVALMNLFYQYFTLASDLDKVASKGQISITLPTDSKSLSDIQINGSRTSENAS